MAQWLAIFFTVLVVAVAIAPIMRLIKAWYKKQAREKHNED